jgi:hypothetical protein
VAQFSVSEVAQFSVSLDTADHAEGVGAPAASVEALQAARQQPVADVDETGAPTGNAVDEVLRAAVGNNPTRRRGWLWV